MFEKEAEDNKPPYAFCALDTKCELWKDGFQKGAEYGYNKANEWHYVKDGDLPKDESDVLVYSGEDWRMCVGRYSPKYKAWEAGCDTIAWKEIVLPELPKESE